MKTVVLSGADRGFGLALTKEFLNHGWRVFAGQFMPEWKELDQLREQWGQALTILPLDVSSSQAVGAFSEAIAKQTASIDMLINNSGISAGSAVLGGEIEFDAILRAYNVNALGALRLTEAMLPLLEKGEEKRICFVSSEASSLQTTTRERNFGYSMTKAAMNMAARSLIEKLRKEDFTFRLFHPGWMRSYMNGFKSVDGDLEPEESAVTAAKYFIQPQASEDVLMLMDYHLRVLPF